MQFPATSMHGDRMQREREEALRHFKIGYCNILVATNVAGRGLDIPLVAHVVNYDLPEEITEYVHRIGRTGRIGNEGRSTSFFDPSRDGPLSGDLLRVLRDAQQQVPPFLEREASANAYGPGGGGGLLGSGYGGRDFRRRYGGRGGSSGGGMNPLEEPLFKPGGVPLEEDEFWD